MRRFVLMGAAALFAFAMAAADASAATLYSQSNTLRGPEGAVECSGVSKGTCKISETGVVGTHPTAHSDNVKVQCSAKGAAPGNYTVYWTCTNTARGCHSQACGFISLGTLTVNAFGKGKFTATKGNNPFPGKYVHLDLTGPQLLTAVYAGIPIGVGPAVGAESAQPGDPTSH